MNTSGSSLLPVMLLLAAAAPAMAMPQVLIATGDVLPGTGTVSDITDLAIADDGRWAASVVFEGAVSAHALVLDGAVLIGPTAPLPGLPAHTLRGAGCLGFDDSGAPTWVATDVGLSQPTGFGAYVGTTPLLVVGQPVAGPGIPAGATVDAVHQVRPIAAGRYLVGLTFRVGGGAPRSLIARLEEQPGGALQWTAVVQSGDLLPGHPVPVAALDPWPESLGTNVHGEALFVAHMADLATAVYRGTTQIAGPAAPASLPPQLANWSSLAHAPVAMNADGRAVIGGKTGSKERLVWHLMQPVLLQATGASTPATWPHGVDHLFTGHQSAHPYPSPVHVTPDHDEIWFASWEAPAAGPDNGIFRGGQRLFTEGAVVASGRRVVDFLPLSAWAIGPVWACDTHAAQFVLRGALDDGRIAAVRLEPPVHALTYGGCSPSESQLFINQQYLELGATVSFQATDAPSPAAVAFAAVSTASAIGASPCGPVLPGTGELLISLAPNEWFSNVPAEWYDTVNGKAYFHVGPIPADGSAAGLSVYLQVVWLDPTPLTPEPVRLSNGLRIGVGS